MAPRLLVLEDDDGIRASLTLAMGDEGFDVDPHAGAETALASVLAHGTDLMVVDLMLGGLDGFTFIRQVRTHSHAPIIVLSARTGTDDIVHALEAGADDYVTKPYVVREPGRSAAGAAAASGACLGHGRCCPGPRGAGQGARRRSGPRARRRRRRRAPRRRAGAPDAHRVPAARRAWPSTPGGC
ncbi:hypothetical protein GCM10025868_18060 [Angustibacter aerolatus]|uniref:Response regulatory domain-containing protein n=1 Tax=Angustibacter aerolatus TaxID=1162965 RepID=A0ABQ6JIF0_9ACTN|nr:response regulator [Angustibacter aerolatus]GMA86556.1 hypothetical protein GCM10025868_18060 [Angustibacter aerolatus]